MHSKVISLLLNHGVNLDAIKDKKTFIQENSSSEMLTLLIQQDPTFLNFVIHNSHFTDHYRCYTAARAGIAVFSSFMKTMDKEKQDTLLKEALKNAINDDNLQVVTVLIDYARQHNNVTGVYYGSLLLKAVKNNSRQVAEFFLKKTQFLIYHSSSLFQIAIANNDPEMLSLLLCYIDINRQNNDGQTALHYAILGAHFSMAAFLLDRGAKILPNTEGKTPLDLLINHFVWQGEAHQKVRDLQSRMAPPVTAPQASRFLRRSRSLDILPHSKPVDSLPQSIPKEVDNDESMQKSIINTLHKPLQHAVNVFVEKFPILNNIRERAFPQLRQESDPKQLLTLLNSLEWSPFENDWSLQRRFMPHTPEYRRISASNERYALFCQAYDMEFPFESITLAEHSDEFYHTLIDFRRFLTQQTPFIKHIKKLLPAVGDGRWNPCLHTLEGILIWNEKSSSIYFNVFRRTMGILLDFFHDATIAGPRIDNSPHGFVALLEMDKALVNAYYRACKKTEYLSFVEDEEGCRSDLLSDEFRQDLITFIENWQDFIQSYYPTLKRVANINIEDDAYHSVTTNKRSDNPIGPVTLFPGALETLYHDTGKSFTPLRGHTIRSSSPAITPAFSLTKQLEKLSLQTPLKKAESYPTLTRLKTQTRSVL